MEREVFSGCLSNNTLLFHDDMMEEEDAEWLLQTDMLWH